MTTTEAAEMGDETTTYTVDDALTSMGFGKFQALVLGYAGMGWVAEAMEMMLLSFVGPSVQSEWGLSSGKESLITSIVFAGMLIGAYSWGIVSDNYGRRKGFIYTALVTSGAGFLSSFSPNYTSLIILRFLVGVGLGGGPVLASWFLEFVPAPNRGTWMMVFSSFWTFGTILEASVAWVVMPKLGWRWLLALSSLPSFLLLLFYNFVPESPRYLCMKGRTTDALHVLENVARVNRTHLPSGLLISGRKTELDQTELSSEGTRLVSGRRHENIVAESANKIGGFTALITLLSPKLARSTLLLWMVFFGNAFSYYGVVLLTSELSKGNQRCASTTLHLPISGGTNIYKDVFITSFAEIPGLILSAAALDRVGRKITMSALLFLCCIFLIPLVLHQTEVLTTTLLFGARTCISASFTILYIYAPEVYPTSVRTTGLGIGSSVGRIGGIICPLVAVGLVHDCHQSMAIILFVVITFLSGIAVTFFPLETKGRELSDTVSSSK